jgi:TolA-binding protein
MTIFNEAELQLSQGEYLQAIKTHNTLLKKYPDSQLAPESLFRKGHIYYRYLDNIEMAMMAYHELALLYPESVKLVDAAKDRGEIYSTLGKHWKAVQEYEWLLTRARHSERGDFQYLIAMEYFKMNDFKQARIEFTEILNTNSATALAPEIHFRIATSFYLEKNLVESLKAYKLVVKKFPNHGLAFQSSINIAQIYADAEKLTEAIDMLKRLKIKSSNNEKELIDIRIALIKKRIKKPNQKRRR